MSSSESAWFYSLLQYHPNCSALNFQLRARSSCPFVVRLTAKSWGSSLLCVPHIQPLSPSACPLYPHTLMCLHLHAPHWLSTELCMGASPSCTSMNIRDRVLACPHLGQHLVHGRNSEECAESAVGSTPYLREHVCYNSLPRPPRSPLPSTSLLLPDCPKGRLIVLWKSLTGVLVLLIK